VTETYDILIIGGGVNGAGIARDAAGRGISVLLCEKGDLASATSSASTKLIHGGLRYLEHYEFRLVRESLIERETLLNAAPHIIWPMRFVLPHHKDLRPRWMLRAGLFIYDHLGGRRTLPATTTVRFENDLRGAPLKEFFRYGYEYSDCWVEDSRLVVLNAVDAVERGATLRTRTKVTGLTRGDGVWTARLEDAAGRTEEARAKVVVNAAGPWVNDVVQNVAQTNAKPSFGLRLVKGSHIIVSRLYDGAHAYLFQSGDGRIIFAIPYERNFTLIGTTDVPYEDEPGTADITETEIDYLCRSASEYFRLPVAREQVRATYAGVRPLFDNAEDKNASAVTRDYVFNVEGDPAMLSIYGGKITTYRKLAEHALEKLGPILPKRAGAWTAGAPLPGGDMQNASFDAFRKDATQQFPWLEHGHLQRLLRAYGTRIGSVLGGATSYEALGRHYGAGLTDAEIQYLQNKEFASTADDILRRRSKLYLHLTDEEVAAVRARCAGAYAAA
jgi:glycerol-3-phosphate dehydrogenase